MRPGQAAPDHANAKLHMCKDLDAGVGRRIEEKVRKGRAPEPAAGMGEA